MAENLCDGPIALVAYKGDCIIYRGHGNYGDFIHTALF